MAMSPRVLLSFLCALAVVTANESYDTGGGAAEFQEYHYNLPIKELHTHVAQPYPKVKAPKPSSISEQLYGGGQVAAAVAAAQHAHAQSQSHYTKPGSAVLDKVASLSYSPVSSPYTYNYGIKPKKAGIAKKPLTYEEAEGSNGYLYGDAGIGVKGYSDDLDGQNGYYSGAKPTAIAKKPTHVAGAYDYPKENVGVYKKTKPTIDAEGAHGYLHGSYAPAMGGYALMPGYGYSAGYPGVGYGNHGAGFGGYGYSGFPYGGINSGYYGGGAGLGLGYVSLPAGYALGGIAPHGIHGGHGLGGYGYGGGVGGYPALGGLGVGGYGLGGLGGGGGLGLGHGGGLGHGHGGYYGGVYRR